MSKSRLLITGLEFRMKLNLTYFKLDLVKKNGQVEWDLDCHL